MKILVFNGSPKKERSDTMHITRAFLGGMNEAAPQEVQSINVADMHIEFCRGCFACKYNGGRCAIDDDMREILEQMLASDLLLFSFPLYCYGMPAMLKKHHRAYSAALVHGDGRDERTLCPRRAAGLFASQISDDLRLRISEPPPQF